MVLHRETRSFIKSTAGHDTTDTPQRTERQEQQLVKKLKELKREAAALEGRYQELVDQLNPGSSTSTDVSEASEDSSSSSVNHRLDFNGMTRFAQSDARSTIVAMGLPIAALLETLSQQDDVAEHEPPGSAAWCKAVATGIQRLIRIHDVLNQHGQQYADKGGTNDQFLDWVDQKITDVWEEQGDRIALARTYAEAMRQNGYHL